MKLLGLALVAGVVLLAYVIGRQWERDAGLERMDRWLRPD